MRSKKMLGTLVAFIIVFAIFPAAIKPIVTEALIKIDPDLLEQMEEGDGRYTAVVKVMWDPDLEPIKFNHDAVISELKAEAAETQGPVITYLKQKRDAEVINTFWLTNAILVEAEEGTIRELATLTTVEKVIASFNLTVSSNSMEPAGDFVVAEAGDPEVASTSWNIERVRAPEVWDMGITGEGIRFATSDTGIHLGHPDLAGTLYSDDYSDPTYPGGWIEFDADGNIVPGSVPHDTDGHGTATYGLMVGDAAGPYGAIGVAPGAGEDRQGMHALNLPYGTGTFPQVVAGLQWIIDPVDQYGNPAGEWARVSSHSWGASGHQDAVLDPINNMYYAGHVAVAATGNEGECSTRSPGNVYRCIGVGATDEGDYVPSWSSGCVEDWPESWPEPYIKPDISAPGYGMITPYPPDTYRQYEWYGTSFSSPHVGGAAILMLSGNPSLTPDEVREALQETAVWYDYYYPERPDTRYGWGRLDCYEAVMMVALPQGVRGVVTDVDTGEPLSQVNVYAHEADRSVYTDEDGYYDMRLTPGTYTVTFSRFGYYDQTVSDVVVHSDVFTWLDKTLEPAPPGFVEGHVYFLPTGIGIPGATVEVLDVPIILEAETDATGYYHLALPPGTYDLEASAFHFSSDLEEGVVVTVGETTTVDFDLEQPGKIAVVDYYGYGSKIVDFLTAEGYTVDAYGSIAAILPHITDYGCVIANNFGYIYSSDLTNFIDATDANGIGVLWLDSWSSYCGAYWLNSYLGWPPSRYTYYSSAIEHLYYRVTQTDSDIVPGWTVGDKIIFDESSYYKDHAYYRNVVDGDIPGIGLVKTLADAGYYRYGYDTDEGQGMIKVTRPDNKWVVLSMHGNTYYTNVDNWHADSKEVFINAVNWVTKPHVGIAKFVKFDLDVEPEETMWKYPTTVSVCIKNVGWIPGTHTVEMYVDGILEGTETVTLEPGEWTCIEWEVSRFDVGTYTVKVQHLTTTFRVRPPRVTLKAYEFSTDQPLECADVYGCYQKYAGPGWYEQWSYTYGGYGHSQHAQPIGDIDEDGVNEIIVGGYETIGYGLARILSYDAGLGTYIEEHQWYVPGGSYHSPSGSTVLDLDDDGDNEFVISWTYSGADGIYAYDWDGSTLDELDYYPCGFVFDVYSCDYDEDGDVEVLIANAPWGGTPWHVMAFRWEAGGFVEEASWLLAGYDYMECPMIWSGDTDNDGHTEVVACMSDSSYSTVGTWALNWNSGTEEWEEELVYDDLICSGTHYGVTVGDVNGNGIDEIGIGNNVDGYYGAGAVLIEWNPATNAYEKVWEHCWPDDESVIEALAIGDVDCDGENEFCVGGGDVHIIGWTGTAYVEESTITETMGLLSGVNIGDMDNDGLNELKACDIIGLGPGKEWIFKYAKEPSPIPGCYFEYLGHTDENGMLEFDSPASVVEMCIVVYKGEKSEKGYQYLLQECEMISNDKEVIFEPHADTDGVIVSKLNPWVVSQFPHVGITWLHKKSLCCQVLWPFVTYFNDPAKIVVTPCETYNKYHWLNIVDDWGSWWYYFMNPTEVHLNPGEKYTNTFGGPILGSIEVDQSEATVTIDWDATDTYGHQITGILLEEVDWLDPESAIEPSIQIPKEPMMLEDVETLVEETVEYYPNIAVYAIDHKALQLIDSGYVSWDKKTLTMTAPVKAAQAKLKFVAGPYANPNEKIGVIVIIGT